MGERDSNDDGSKKRDECVTTGAISHEVYYRVSSDAKRGGATYSSVKTRAYRSVFSVIVVFDAFWCSSDNGGSAIALGGTQKHTHLQYTQVHTDGEMSSRER